MTRAGFNVTPSVRAAGFRAGSSGGGVDSHCCFWRCCWSERWMTHPTMGTFRAAGAGVRVSLGPRASVFCRFFSSRPWPGRRDRRLIEGRFIQDAINSV